MGFLIVKHKLGDIMPIFVLVIIYIFNSI